MTRTTFPDKSGISDAWNCVAGGKKDSPTRDDHLRPMMSEEGFKSDKGELENMVAGRIPSPLYPHSLHSCRRIRNTLYPTGLYDLDSCRTHTHHSLVPSSSCRHLCQAHMLSHKTDMISIAYAWFSLMCQHVILARMTRRYSSWWRF